MRFTIQQIAQSLGAEAAGDLELTIVRASEPGDATADDLALAMSPKYAEELGAGNAQAAIVWPDADWQAMGLKAAIFAPRPRMAMAGVTVMLDAGQGEGRPVLGHILLLLQLLLPPSSLSQGQGLGRVQLFIFFQLWFLLLFLHFFFWQALH